VSCLRPTEFEDDGKSDMLRISSPNAKALCQMHAAFLCPPSHPRQNINKEKLINSIYTNNV
jgi:hypothetical protein